MKGFISCGNTCSNCMNKCADAHWTFLLKSLSSFCYITKSGHIIIKNVHCAYENDHHAFRKCSSCNIKICRCPMCFPHHQISMDNVVG